MSRFMSPFIVGHGFCGKTDIVYAADLASALNKARAFGMSEGMSAEEAGDPDYCWSRPYDFYLARDMGLAWLDQHEKGWITAEARP